MKLAAVEDMEQRFRAGDDIFGPPHYQQDRSNTLCRASLEVMKHDSRLMRGRKPFLFTNCKTGEGIPAVVELIEKEFLFDMRPQRQVG